MDNYQILIAAATAVATIAAWLIPRIRSLEKELEFHSNIIGRMLNRELYYTAKLKKLELENEHHKNQSQN